MPKPQATNTDESARGTLSAMLDDEAQELELRRVLRDFDDNQELRSHWYRLQVVRSAMSSEPVWPANNFAGKVRAAINEEAQIPAPSATANRRRAFASFAVAASVALVVVVGGQQLALTTNEQSAELARVAPLPVGVVNTLGAVPVQASYGSRSLPALESADRTAYRELARQRLRLHSQEHAEHASLNTPQGMLPFARVPEIEPVGGAASAPVDAPVKSPAKAPAAK